MGITAFYLSAFLLYGQICGSSWNVNIASYASRLYEQLVCTVLSSCTNVPIKHCRYGQMLCDMSYVYSSCVCKVRVAYVSAHTHSMCMQMHGNPMMFCSDLPNSYQLVNWSKCYSSASYGVVFLCVLQSLLLIPRVRMRQKSSRGRKGLFWGLFCFIFVGYQWTRDIYQVSKWELLTNVLHLETC